MVSVKEATVSRLQLSVERMLRERDTVTRNHLAEKKTLTEERVREGGREGGGGGLTTSRILKGIKESETHKKTIGILA